MVQLQIQFLVQARVGSTSLNATADLVLFAGETWAQAGPLGSILEDPLKVEPYAFEPGRP